MFGIGGFELFIILIFGFLIFGPDKLPEIAKTVGKGIARFREAQQEMNETLGGEKLIDLDNPDEPFKNPIDALDRIAQRQEEKKGASSGAKKTEVAKAPAEADGGTGDGSDQPKQESFTERKARYERERAARKAAEAEAAKAAKAEAAAKAGAPADAGDVATNLPANSPESATPAAATSAEPATTDAVATADAPAEGGDA